LLEVFEDFGIFGDVFPVEGEGVGGHYFESVVPALFGFRCGLRRKGDGFEAGGDHDFEIPLG